MHPLKGAFDNKPSVVGNVPRVPGSVGWGLRGKVSLMTDEMRIAWPNRAKKLDKERSNDFYNAMNQ